MIESDVTEATHGGRLVSPIRDLFHEICELQRSHLKITESELSRRGMLIRNEIPNLLLPHLPALAELALIPSDDALVVGRDGTGVRSHVPWVRIASRLRSPAPTRGWYVVYLWSRDGAGVYLVLAHGSSTYRGGSFVTRSAKELRGYVQWARDVLGAAAHDHRLAVPQVQLRSRARLALAYERSCPVALFYPRDNLPNDGDLIDDLGYMMKLLGRVYEQERLGRTPMGDDPEVRDALIELQGISSPLRRVGQGFGLDAEERRAIESHAMEMAKAKLKNDGYMVVDCGATESYDIRATKDGADHFIEVKGTTGRGEQVLLTANEVQLHLKKYPYNGLFIVSEIELRRGSPPTVYGGHLSVRMPWMLDKENLRALSFAYRTQDAG